ncbi:hypothetical protein GAY28_30535 [Azospirillum brasilense]|nr:hypothetical protein [Azospirillum brasilense]
MLFVVSEEQAVNAIPHYHLFDDAGFGVADLALTPEETQRMQELWKSLFALREYVTEQQKADNAEYHRMGETGYRRAMPERETIDFGSPASSCAGATAVGM